MRDVGKWVAGVVAAVISGVLIYWLTTGWFGGDAADRTLPSPTNQSTNGNHATSPGTTTQPPSELSFLERVKGDWAMQSWTEAGGPVTLYIDVWDGTLTVTDQGMVDWQMKLDDKGEKHTPQPAIKCGGQTTLGGGIEGVPGGGRNAEINWTSDLQSANYSTTGEDRITRALCGWATIGTRAPFTVTLAGPNSAPAAAMEMTNQYGTFRWTRP